MGGGWRQVQQLQCLPQCVRGGPAELYGHRGGVLHEGGACTEVCRGQADSPGSADLCHQGHRARQGAVHGEILAVGCVTVDC